MSTYLPTLGSGTGTTVLNPGILVGSSTTITTPTIYSTAAGGTYITNVYTGAKTVNGYVSIDDGNVYFDGGTRLSLKNTRGVMVDGEDCTIELLDGSKISINKDGNCSIEDKDAKVIYKSNNVREFNRFINAGDLIEEFIKDVKKLGVTQKKLLHMPINVFFVWLVWKAAEADGEQPPIDTPKLEYLPDIKSRLSCNNPRCKFCCKFLSRNRFEAGVNFCNEEHMGKYIKKLDM